MIRVALLSLMLASPAAADPGSAALAAATQHANRAVAAGFRVKITSEDGYIQVKVGGRYYNYVYGSDIAAPGYYRDSYRDWVGR